MKRVPCVVIRMTFYWHSTTFSEFYIGPLAYFLYLHLANGQDGPWSRCETNTSNCVSLFEANIALRGVSRIVATASVDENKCRLLFFVAPLRFLFRLSVDCTHNTSIKFVTFTPYPIFGTPENPITSKYRPLYRQPSISKTTEQHFLRDKNGRAEIRIQLSSGEGWCSIWWANFGLKRLYKSTHARRHALSSWTR